MTKTTLTTQAQEIQIVILNNKSLDQHPAMIYLAGLRSPNSRANMQRHLNTIAHLLGAVKSITIDQTNGRDKKLDNTFLSVAWESLRFQHTTMIKTRWTRVQ